MDFEEIVYGRHSVREFEPTFTLSDADLQRLFRLAIRSPSSFNLQPWRFIVVRERERLARLQQAAYGQKQVGRASAVIVVAGKLSAYRDAPRLYAALSPEARASLTAKVERYYADNRAMQRDEAIRGASLAAMTLLFAAHTMGLGASPMIGFNPAAVAELVHLDAEHIPVMLIALGKPIVAAPNQTDRLPVTEVVRLERLDGPGLAASL